MKQKKLGQADLEKTVLTFAESGMKIGTTAKRMYLNRGTIVFRLTQVETQTGLNPKEFYDLCELVHRIKGVNH